MNTFKNLTRSMAFNKGLLFSVLVAFSLNIYTQDWALAVFNFLLGLVIIGLIVSAEDCLQKYEVRDD